MGVGNFNKFVRTLQLGKKCLKLVSGHQELFRKWVTFQATPKKDKDFVYSVRPLEYQLLAFPLPRSVRKQTNPFTFPLAIACLLLFSLRVSGSVPANGI